MVVHLQAQLNSLNVISFWHLIYVFDFVCYILSSRVQCSSKCLCLFLSEFCSLFYLFIRVFLNFINAHESFFDLPKPEYFLLLCNSKIKGAFFYPTLSHRELDSIFNKLNIFSSQYSIKKILSMYFTRYINRIHYLNIFLTIIPIPHRYYQ